MLVLPTLVIIVCRSPPRYGGMRKDAFMNVRVSISQINQE